MDVYDYSSVLCNKKRVTWLFNLDLDYRFHLCGTTSEVIAFPPFFPRNRCAVDNIDINDFLISLSYLIGCVWNKGQVILRISYSWERKFYKKPSGVLWSACLPLGCSDRLLLIRSVRCVRCVVFRNMYLIVKTKVKLISNTYSDFL